MSDFSEACDTLERALGARQPLVADLARSRPFAKGLARLREHVRAHSVDPILSSFDHRTRQEGFHVLHDWDGNRRQGERGHDSGRRAALRRAEKRGADPVDRAALGVMLDYYFAHLLALLSLRIFDDGAPDAGLDRLNGLLAALQSADGSGQRFAADAETLMLIATSHFELQEMATANCSTVSAALNASHRANIAIGHAASMGCHLRFGFEATYGRDTLKMRDDNVADYPWLCFALVNVMREYRRLRDVGSPAAGARGVVEAMLNGLSADARAFLGVAPPASLLHAIAAGALEFRDAFHAYRRDLVDEFEPHRPNRRRYSPLSFFFNFSHNVVKGTVVDALLAERAVERVVQRDVDRSTVRREPDMRIRRGRIRPTIANSWRAR